MKKSASLLQARPRGFTLIEVLVVVAIIALMVSILLPALSRTREQARSAQCLTQLKQMIHGVVMYAGENKSTLPGPAHYLLYINSHKWEGAGSGEQGTLWARMNLSFKIGRYLGDKRAKNLDEVATCPSAARILAPQTIEEMAKSAGQPWYYQLPVYYIANTGAGGANLQNIKPYYATDPRHYFGKMNLGNEDSLRSVTLLNKKEDFPKKIDAIRFTSREWALADLWYWEAKPPRGAVRRVGTWPFDLVSNESGSVSAGGRLKIPAYPFHLANANYDPDVQNSADKDANSPRLTSGRTNAAYFDGHCEPVRIWEGTKNPCFDKNGDGACD